MTRFVVDCDTLLRIASGEIEVAPEHELLAPALVRSQALEALYRAARRGEIPSAQGVKQLRRINELKVRFLGDRVLQRNAWEVADRLGWDATADAEFVAVAELKGASFVTCDPKLARRVSRLVAVAPVEALRA